MDEIPSDLENHMMKKFFGASEPDEFTSDTVYTTELQGVVSSSKVIIELFKILTNESTAQNSPKEVKEEPKPYIDPELDFESEHLSSSLSE